MKRVQQQPNLLEIGFASSLPLQTNPLNPFSTAIMTGQEYIPPSTDLITLTRHVLNEGFNLARSSAASGDLTILLTSLQTTCKFIESNVRKASLINL